VFLFNECTYYETHLVFRVILKTAIAKGHSLSNSISFFYLRGRSAVYCHTLMGPMVLCILNSPDPLIEFGYRSVNVLARRFVDLESQVPFWVIQFLIDFLEDFLRSSVE
jgi:hypothetical protein